MASKGCTATTRNGTNCTAPPLKGTDRCLAHSPAKVRESVGFVPDNGKAGRKRLPRPAEVAQRLVEENVLALQRPYWRTLGYDVRIGENGPMLVELEDGGAKLYGTSKDGDVCVSDAEDLGAMIAAAERLQDRIYGRPKQQTELTGADGGPVMIEEPPDAEAKSARAALLLSKLGQLEASESDDG